MPQVPLTPRANRTQINDHVGASLAAEEDESQMDFENDQDSNYDTRTEIEAEKALADLAVADLAKACKIGMRDAIQCFKNAEATIVGQLPVDPEMKTLLDELYARVTGCGWVDDVVEKVVEATRYASRDVDALTENVTAVAHNIREMEDRLMTRLQALEAATTTGWNTNTPTTQTHTAPNASYATGPTINPGRKTQTNAPKKPPANPLSPHHPSRLVVQVLPEGVKPDDRPEPAQLIKDINARLANSAEAKHLMVVSTKWNAHERSRTCQTRQPICRPDCQG
ncbi:hypothetical protein B0H11DRAFT_1901317 [Mycena galericulata]|nr:hypothetical protein B0H11DRAFT_1901317 [Mycena galericulata]